MENQEEESQINNYEEEEPPVNKEEYLAPNSQEEDIPKEDANPDNKSDCEYDSKQHLYDTTNNNTFPNKTELYDAIIAMKNDIYKDIFQSGPPEKVHDTELLNIYVGLIGSIWKSILHNIPIDELNNYSETIKGAIQKFLTTLSLHLTNTENNQETNLMRTRFLKLHLHCFPYCLNHECLVYD